MGKVIEILNLILKQVFDLLFAPFRRFDPLWAMLLISLLSALMMLWIYARISHQEAIRHKKNVIRGNLLGVRLFQHDVRVVLRIQAQILVDTFSYMRHSLLPMLVMMVPLLLIIVQLNLNFALRPVSPGDSTLVEVRLADASLLEDIEIEPPQGVVVETPKVRIPSQKTAAWRIRAERAGDFRLRFKAGEEVMEKQLVAGKGWKPVSPRRSDSLLDLLLYPAEAQISASSRFRSITVDYPALPLTLWGWNLHWLVAFFILSVLFSFALKGFMGVEL